MGTEGRSAESVAEKAAVVTYRPLRRTLQDQIRLVKQLYDARSKYVHEGKPFPIGDIIQAEQVAAEVLWSLLTVSGSGTLSNTSEWLRKINYLAAAIKDGRVLPEAEFAALGIVGTEVTRTPPNRVPRGSDRTDAALIMTLYHGRIRELLANAQPYHDAYSKAATFGGPSLYFHQRALATRRPPAALPHLECVYATLASWGMHRMGKGGSKMQPFDVFARSLEGVERVITMVWNE